eukprot:CAMPEP_0177273588 /NCGR_PEP_ID=MMETSP0367-20130122/66692_1 /TAXON_ID=447022 ORGANISM="Scrippsiella hangoei-like, Strain SHHI-4" /NCGR_SAMPLE_ID=MMETSP0367 /ASSEMBLY_ACC=CAM_ASM_000362 /LENGTH=34 /DNA_ID= /DNA_START= /DNA_END= /DNA_ORIENTATION=
MAAGACDAAAAAAGDDDAVEAVSCGAAGDVGDRN